MLRLSSRVFSGLRFMATKASDGPRLRRNLEIQGVPNVLLVDASGAQIGIVSFTDALRQATAADLDLVEVSPKANPPVCKIYDFKQAQEEERKNASAHKPSKEERHSRQEKEIKLTTRIEVHDFQVKLRLLHRFLEDGHPVRVSVDVNPGRGPNRPTPEEMRANAESLFIAIAKELDGAGTMGRERGLNREKADTYIQALVRPVRKDKGEKKDEKKDQTVGLAAATANAPKGVVQNTQPPKQ